MLPFIEVLLTEEEGGKHTPETKMFPLKAVAFAPTVYVQLYPVKVRLQHPLEVFVAGRPRKATETCSQQVPVWFAQSEATLQEGTVTLAWSVGQATYHMTFDTLYIPMTDQAAHTLFTRVVEFVAETLLTDAQHVQGAAVWHAASLVQAQVWVPATWRSLSNSVADTEAKAAKMAKVILSILIWSEICN